MVSSICCHDTWSIESHSKVAHIAGRPRLHSRTTFVTTADSSGRNRTQNSNAAFFGLCRIIIQGLLTDEGSLRFFFMLGTWYSGFLKNNCTSFYPCECFEIADLPLSDSLFQWFNGISVSTMFKNTFQSGFLSILYSVGSKPLQIWDKKVIWQWAIETHDATCPVDDTW